MKREELINKQDDIREKYLACRDELLSMEHDSDVLRLIFELQDNAYLLGVIDEKLKEIEKQSDNKSKC